MQSHGPRAVGVTMKKVILNVYMGNISQYITQVSDVAHGPLVLLLSTLHEDF
jgi:hypothetical protein